MRLFICILILSSISAWAVDPIPPLVAACRRMAGRVAMRMDTYIEHYEEDIVRLAGRSKGGYKKVLKAVENLVETLHKHGHLIHPALEGFLLNGAINWANNAEELRMVSQVLGGLNHSTPLEKEYWASRIAYFARAYEGKLSLMKPPLTDDNREKARTDVRAVMVRHFDFLMRVNRGYDWNNEQQKLIIHPLKQETTDRMNQLGIRLQLDSINGVSFNLNREYPVEWFGATHSFELRSAAHLSKTDPEIRFVAISNGMRNFMAPVYIEEGKDLWFQIPHNVIPKLEPKICDLLAVKKNEIGVPEFHLFESKSHFLVTDRELGEAIIQLSESAPRIAAQHPQIPFGGLTILTKRISRHEFTDYFLRPVKDSVVPDLYEVMDARGKPVTAMVGDRTLPIRLRQLPYIEDGPLEEAPKK